MTALGSLALPVNAATAGFAYLVVVLGVAAAWGLAEAIAASVAAMLCLNFFFLPPVGRFTIAEPENWAALFAFLATALVASHLSDRARKQAEQARERQRETEQLYALSRAILLSEPGQSAGSQAARHIARIFECRGVAVYDATTGELFLGGSEDRPGLESRMKQVAMQGASLREAPDLLVSAVTLGGRPIGSLALWGTMLSDGALQALLNLVAITLERVRSEEARNRAEVARQSEEFKSTLLDAIAHEFKTPLTAIKAASTSMLTDGALAPQLRELTSIIDEETDRLNLLVTEAVHMSRIEAGKVRLNRRSLALDELARRVLDYFGPRLEGREVELKADEHLPLVGADGELVSLALRQLMDNALKFSPPASPIEITAEAAGERVIVRIRDHGPGVPEGERERIFEKFYRREAAKDRPPGSGLGLHIAREIARAHGGDLWVEGAAGLGSEFCLALPARDEVHRP